MNFYPILIFNIYMTSNINTTTIIQNKHINIVTHPKSMTSQEILMLDNELLKLSMKTKQHFFHTHYLTKTISKGILSDPLSLDQHLVKQNGFHLVKRGTGGGILIHDGDLSFGIILSNKLTC